MTVTKSRREAHVYRGDSIAKLNIPIQHELFLMIVNMILEIFSSVGWCQAMITYWTKIHRLLVLYKYIAIIH